MYDKVGRQYFIVHCSLYMSAACQLLCCCSSTDPLEEKSKSLDKCLLCRFPIGCKVQMSLLVLYPLNRVKFNVL
jgi:hypothetical protein